MLITLHFIHYKVQEFILKKALLFELNPLLIHIHTNIYIQVAQAKRFSVIAGSCIIFLGGRGGLQTKKYIMHI